MVALLIVPAMGLQEDFQNYDPGTAPFSLFRESGGALPTVTTTIQAYSPETELKELQMHVVMAVASTASIYYSVPQTATNWSVVVRTDSSTVDFRFYEADLTTFVLYNTAVPAYMNIRYDFILTPTNTIRVYGNGSYLGSTAALGLTPSYFFVGVAGGPGTRDIWIDDYIISPSPSADSSTRNIAEGLPNDYYVVIDTLAPGNNGIYNQSVGAVRTGPATLYTTKFSRISNETTVVQVNNFNSGTIYEQLAIIECINETGWNVSSLIPAPSGLYRVYSSESGSSSTFWVVGYGATFAFDKDTYANSETASATWSIQPAYYDVSATGYTYNGKIVNTYGTTIKTWSITSASGTETTILDSTSYPTGTYYGLVSKTSKIAPYNETVMMFDTMAISNTVTLDGIVYDYAGLGLPATKVNLTQSSTTTQHTATPKYNQSALTLDTINLTAFYTAGGYQHIPVEFTPLFYGTHTINLYLSQDVPNITAKTPGLNNTIFGFVKTKELAQPVTSATVHISNTTHLDNQTVNSTGYYRFYNLTPESIYTLWATAPGFNTSDNYNVNSTTVINTVIYNATRQDIEMDQIYNLKVDVKRADATSTYVTDPITIAITTGTTTNSTTTTTGTANFSTTYALYAIAVSGSGYATSTTSTVVSSDMVVTVYLSESETTSTTNLNSMYPREVTFLITDRWNNAQTGVNVSVVMLSSTIDGTNWWQTLFGIPSSATLINTTVMNGTTDDHGSIIFPMIASGKYQITLTKAVAGINEVKVIYPSQTSYTIVVATTASAVSPSKSSFITENLSVINAGATIGLRGVYNDTSYTTTEIIFFVNYSNHTPLYSNRYSTTPATHNLSVTYFVPNTKGYSYVWGINGTSSTWGFSPISQGITMKGLTGMLVNPFDPTRTGWG